MEEQVLLLKELDIDTWDHFLHYMKLVCSFGKKVIMTDKGIEYATELTNRWKDQEELDEEEHFCLILLGTELAMLRKDKFDLPIIQKFYNEAIKKYEPSYEYMKNFAQITMIEKGYCMKNPQYFEEIEKLFALTSHYMAMGGLEGIPKDDKVLR